jgi:pSer/pThr/pTyr-binding forkhead associated (FHA) protein
VRKRSGGAFPERIGLGRAPNVDIRLPLAQVSKYHAFFTSSEDVWTITDAGSRNGTSVNDRLIDPKVGVRLENGFEVGIGPHRLAFYTPCGFKDLLERRASVR